MTDLPPLSVGGRLDAVRSRFVEVGIDALVVTNPNNIRWCVGFTGSYAVLTIGLDRNTLVTDSRYAEQAPVELAAMGADASVLVSSALVTDGASTLVDASNVGLEADDITWADQQRWESAIEGELVATNALITELRSVKTAPELARMQRAAAIVDEALAEVAPMLVAGTSERALAQRLDDGMRARGASGPAYETIVASGPNAALPHARPSDRVFAPGDMIVIDAGALVDGYRSDMTRTFVIGDPDATASEIHKIATEAQAAGVAAVRSGVTVGSIDAVCRDFITEAGFGAQFGHGTGHGVGLDIHELPAVRSGNTAILQRGQVITVEPGIYLPGVGGVRVEDMVVVTDDGCRSLTRYPKEPLCPPSPPTT